MSRHHVDYRSGKMSLLSLIYLVFLIEEGVSQGGYGDEAQGLAQGGTSRRIGGVPFQMPSNQGLPTYRSTPQGNNLPTRKTSSSRERATGGDAWRGTVSGSQQTDRGGNTFQESTYGNQLNIVEDRTTHQLSFASANQNDRRPVDDENDDDSGDVPDEWANEDLGVQQTPRVDYKSQYSYQRGTSYQPETARGYLSPGAAPRLESTDPFRQISIGRETSRDGREVPMKFTGFDLGLGGLSTQQSQLTSPRFSPTPSYRAMTGYDTLKPPDTAHGRSAYVETSTIPGDDDETIATEEDGESSESAWPPDYENDSDFERSMVERDRLPVTRVDLNGPQKLGYRSKKEVNTDDPYVEVQVKEVVPLSIAIGNHGDLHNRIEATPSNNQNYRGFHPATYLGQQRTRGDSAFVQPSEPESLEDISDLQSPLDFRSLPHLDETSKTIKDIDTSFPRSKGPSSKATSPYGKTRGNLDVTVLTDNSVIERPGVMDFGPNIQPDDAEGFLLLVSAATTSHLLSGQRKITLTMGQSILSSSKGKLKTLLDGCTMSTRPK